MYKRLFIWILQGVLYLVLLSYPEAMVFGQRIAYIDSLQSAVAGIKSDTGKARILINLSIAYRPDLVSKEFYYANEALSLSEKAGWEEGNMYAEQLIGDCYNKVMAYNDAITHFKLSIAVARKLKRMDVEAGCLQAMFHSYHGTKDLEQALLCQKVLLDLTEKMGASLNECNQMSAYALCLTDMGRYEEAIPWFSKDIQFAETHFSGKQKMNLLADLLNTMANTYVKMDKPDSALYCLRTAAPLARLTDNYTEEAYINSTLCDVYAAIGKYDSAIIYGERTLKMGEETKNIDLQQHYCQTLSLVFEKTHKSLIALSYYKRFDSLMKIINSSQTTISQVIQLTKINMEQQTEHNRLEKRSFEVIRHNQRTALIATLLAMLTFITSTIFIYRNLRLKQKANRTITLQATSLKKQNAIIDKALREKEMLLKETHHRVKNNLQLISSLLELQASNLVDKSAKDALRAAQRRVLSIATVHSKLYGSDQDEAIEFSAFATDLFARLNNAFSKDGVVQFNNTIPATFFPLNTAVLLGLVLNELITNSFKHAFTGFASAAINVSLEIASPIYILRYYDSGPGLPDGVFDANSGSLGLYLVRRLSKQLKGTASYKFDKGSIFTIIFPNAAT